MTEYEDLVLIQKNKGQRKPVFWHILRSLTHSAFSNKALQHKTFPVNLAIVKNNIIAKNNAYDLNQN